MRQHCQQVATARIACWCVCWLCVISGGCAQLLRNDFHAHDSRLDPSLESMELSDYATNRLADSETKPVDELLRGLEKKPEELPPAKDDNRRPPPSITLTLSQAQAAALEGNLDFRVAQFNPEIATARIYEEIGRFETTFQGTLSRARDNPPPIPPVFDQVNLSTVFESIEDRFEPSVQVPTATGGTVSFREAGARSSFPSRPIPNLHDVQPGIRFEQPLLRNAGVFVNTSPIQLAKLERGRVDAETKLTAIRVVADTEIAYWKLYAAKRNLDIANQQVSYAERQLVFSQRLADGGIQTKVDVLRADSGLQIRKAEAVKQQLAVQLATRELKQLIQLPQIPVDSPTEVELETPPNLVGLAFDRGLLGSKALQNRLELIRLAFELRQKEISLGVSRNKTLPQLDFVFDGRLHGNGMTPGQSARQAFDNDHNYWFTGLAFSLPLAGNQTARAQVRQESFSLAQTRVAMQRKEVEILKQINDAIDNFERSWQRLLVAQVGVEAAEKTYAGELRSFERGDRTSDLVLLSVDSLATAQRQVVDAILDFQQSRVDIALSTGTVLGYSGIQIADGYGDVPPLPTLLVP